MDEKESEPGKTWTFLTNHAHVLICIARNPDVLTREVAVQVGITERAAQHIVADLVHEGYLTRAKIGRRNRYDICRNRALRHPIERDHSIGELVSVLSEFHG